jgi:hypothetical protein
MNLQHRLQVASDLAQLSGIIQHMRDGEELTDDHRAFMKRLMWPWWDLILFQRGGSEKPDYRNYDSPLFDLLLKNQEPDQYRERLNELCDHLWGTLPLEGYVRLYILRLAIELRSSCLALTWRSF